MCVVSLLFATSSEVSGPMNAVFPSTDLCVLQGDHDDIGRLEKAEGSKSRNGGLLQKRTKHVMNIRAPEKTPEALRPKLKLMLLLLGR